MRIDKEIHTIRELTEGYVNNQERGVIGFGGKLDIRPPYQREFVYSDKQQVLVIESVIKGFPLSIMYWNTKDDGTFELLDGQQRTVSICKYVSNNLSVDGKFFKNQPEDIQQKILDYPLDIYKCTGAPSERIEWFQVINVASEVLTNQEILNAIYSGPWTTEAKKKFSKTGCSAYDIGSEFMAGKAIRQDYLETTLKWISNNNVEEYMGKHQHDTNADELWEYYEKVISWVKATFTNYRSEMKGLDWGVLYNKYKDKPLDPEDMEKKIQDVLDNLEDREAFREKGIFEYAITDRVQCLYDRNFTKKQRQIAFNKQKGFCPDKECTQKGKKFKINEMHADHIKPYADCGLTVQKNCRMLCPDCNRRKSDT